MPRYQIIRSPRFSFGTMNGMAPSEGFSGAPKGERLSRQFAKLRQSVHQSMKLEEEKRFRENPIPTDEELYMGAFREWLEPQVRGAVEEMYRKGYATLSSGFHGEEPDLQLIDGFFTIAEKTKQVLQEMGVEVLRGPDIGAPRNKLVTMLRFRAANPSIDAIKNKWDAIAAALPQKSFPQGIRPICDRAEEFRQQYAPAHPSLDEARKKYHDSLRRNVER
jgi:hypothetical protein